MEASGLMTEACSIKDAMDAAWKQYIVQEESQTPSKRPYTYASSYEECERKLVLLMTDGDKQPSFEPETLAKFHRGHDRERNLKIDLARVGQLCRPPFEVIGQQERFTLKNRSEEVVIAGKFDCRLQFSRNCCPPLEIKDWSENLSGRISTFDDCFNSPWTKKGAYQLLMYLLGSGEPFGFLLLGKSGLPALIPVELERHIEKAEEFLARAERAMEHVNAGTLPRYLNDASECQRCWAYGSICQPPLLSGEGAVVLTDPDLEAMLDRREELRAAALEYDGIDSDVKKKLRGVEMGVAGKYLIQGRWGKSTRTELPPEIKKQYTVTDPHGRFTLSIEKVT